MQIKLTKPIETVETVKQTVQRTELALEFLTVNPLDNRLVLKLQPGNREITLNGPAYEEIKDKLESAIAKVLGPVIEARLNQ